MKTEYNLGNAINKTIGVSDVFTFPMVATRIYKGCVTFMWDCSDVACLGVLKAKNKEKCHYPSSVPSIPKFLICTFCKWNDGAQYGQGSLIGQMTNQTAFCIVIPKIWSAINFILLLQSLEDEVLLSIAM